MMFLGNSRVILGKNSSDVVVGVWEAVAPTDAVDGEYGITGTESEIYTMEWVQSRDILLVGGKFNDTINDSTVLPANSIAMFENSSGWTPLAGIGGVTAGVRDIGIGQNNLGTVTSIRDIRNASDTQMILIGGDFTFAGGVFNDGFLHLVQYSIDSGWINQADFRAYDSVYSISNVDFDSTGITAYFGGVFDTIGDNEFSTYLGAYRRNTSTNTSSLIALGADFDSGSNPIYSVFNDTVKDRLYVFYFDSSIFRYDYTAQVEADTTYLNYEDVYSLNYPFPNMVQRTDAERYVYIPTTTQIYYSNPNNPFTVTDAPPQVVSDNITQINLIDYNSGTYLLVSLQGNSTSNIKFYRVSDNSWQEKPVPVPDGLKGANSKINSIVVDPATGTIYVGGKFSFVDANGNTAWNVAKFIPSASKFTPS